MSFLDSLVSVGHLGAASSRVGLNVTGAPSVTWDEQISFITNENCAEGNETLTPERVKEFSII
jgi:hypothetical protein